MLKLDKVRTRDLQPGMYIVIHRSIVKGIEKLKGDNYRIVTSNGCIDSEGRFYFDVVICDHTNSNHYTRVVEELESLNVALEQIGIFKNNRFYIGEHVLELRNGTWVKSEISAQADNEATDER